MSAEPPRAPGATPPAEATPRYVSFAELVEYGRASGGNIVNGMPWSFNFNGVPITHENDECYLVITRAGTQRFTPRDTLQVGPPGQLVVIYAAPVPAPVAPPSEGTTRCPNLECDEGLIRGTFVGCAVCERPITLERLRRAEAERSSASASRDETPAPDGVTPESLEAAGMVRAGFADALLMYSRGLGRKLTSAEYGDMLQRWAASPGETPPRDAPTPCDSATYGELPAEIRALVVNYEWDNMTRAQQRTWLIAALSASQRAREEMQTALRRVGIGRSDECGDSGAVVEWFATTEQGEQGCGTLDVALQRLTDAAMEDGRREVSERFRTTLSEHWLTEIQCHHESGTDTAHCFCTVWASGALPSVGAAVDAWVAHVMDAARAAQPVTP